MSDQSTKIEQTHGTWTEAATPLVQKCEVAVALDLEAVWSKDGARVLGALIKDMARLLDHDAKDMIEDRDRAIEGLIKKNKNLVAIGQNAADTVRQLEKEISVLKIRLKILGEDA